MNNNTEIIYQAANEIIYYNSMAKNEKIQQKYIN